jgi:hypothetical protein
MLVMIIAGLAANPTPAHGGDAVDQNVRFGFVGGE